MSDSIVDRLKRLLIEHGARGAIGPQSTLHSMGFDELDQLEVMMAVTEEFGPDVDDLDVRDLGYLVKVIHQRLGQESPATWETTEVEVPSASSDSSEDEKENEQQFWYDIVEFLVGARQSPIGEDKTRLYGRLLMLMSEFGARTPPGPNENLAEFVGIEPSDEDFLHELESEFHVELSDDFTLGTVSEVLARMAEAKPGAHTYGTVKVAVYSQLVRLAGKTKLSSDDTATTLGFSDETWQTFLDQTSEALSVQLMPEDRQRAKSVWLAIELFLDAADA